MGKIGHSRNNFDDILYCLETVINKKVTNWLKVPHLSTLLPPHFGSQLTKGTPSRLKNQAQLIVVRDCCGIPCTIPVDAPNVYTEIGEALYDKLAEISNSNLGQAFF